MNGLQMIAAPAETWCYMIDMPYDTIEGAVTTASIVRMIQHLRWMTYSCSATQGNRTCLCRLQQHIPDVSDSAPEKIAATSSLLVSRLHIPLHTCKDKHSMAATADTQYLMTLQKMLQQPDSLFGSHILCPFDGVVAPTQQGQGCQGICSSILNAQHALHALLALELDLQHLCVLWLLAL